MIRFLKRSAIAAVAVCCVALPARAYLEYATGGGATVTPLVLMWLSGGAAVPASASAPVPVGDAGNLSFTRWPAVASGAAFPAATRGWRYNCSAASTATVVNSAGDSASWTLYATAGAWVMTPEIPLSVTLGTPGNCLLEAYF